MIRTNLSTRPFYNERAVVLVLLVGALAVVVASVFNVSRVFQLSRSDTQLATEASRDDAQARELRESAARLRASVDPKQLEVASAEARLANDLIDRRTFSWTELFNRFEVTLPDDVRITSVRPNIDRDRGIVLTITVVAKGVEDVSQFMERLEEKAGFKELLSREEHFNDQGQLEASLETVYVPSAGHVGGGGRP